jgi:chromosome segregation ATPase
MGTHTEELFTKANSEVLENAVANHTPIFYKKLAGTNKFLYAHCIHCCETNFARLDVDNNTSKHWALKHCLSDCSKVWFKYDDEFKKHLQKVVLIEKEQQHTEHKELLNTIKIQEEQIGNLKEEIGYLKEDLEDYKETDKKYQKLKSKAEKFSEVLYNEQENHKKTITAILDAYQSYIKSLNEERRDEIWDELNDIAQSVYFKNILEQEDEDE